MRYAPKWPQYARQWDTMKINPACVQQFMSAAQFAFAHKDIYKRIEDSTGAPWALVAVLHKRESETDKNGNPLFSTYLGNGQPLSKRTTITPRGRGPFTGQDAFFNGALDALRIDGLSGVKDWRLEKALYYTELFNGAGYDMRGLPSAYVWGGTNIQKPGKFTSDGKWNGRVMDRQPGTAPLLWTIMKLDPTAILPRET